MAVPRYEEKEAHVPGLPSRLNNTKTFEFPFHRAYVNRDLNNPSKRLLRAKEVEVSMNCKYASAIPGGPGERDVRT